MAFDVKKYQKEYHKRYGREYRRKNRVRINERQREWHQQNITTEDRQRVNIDPLTGKTKANYLNSNRKRHYLKRYGITIDQFNEMLVRQNGVCFLCSCPNSGGRVLSVDHNHGTGKIRKLLCDKCNKGLGQFNENIGIMERAIQYIKDHQ